MIDDQQAEDQAQTVEAAELDGQWSEGQIRFMKRAIAVMSTVLVAGFALVIGRIVYLSGDADKSPAASTPVAMVQGKLAAAAELALPAGSIIRSISLSGNRLAVHFTAANGDGIAIIDLTTGKAVSRVQLSATPPAR